MFQKRHETRLNMEGLLGARVQQYLDVLKVVTEAGAGEEVHFSTTTKWVTKA